MSKPSDQMNAAFSLEDDLAAAEAAATLPASMHAQQLASADSAPPGDARLAAGLGEVQPADDQPVPTYPSGAQQPRPLQQSLEGGWGRGWARCCERMRVRVPAGNTCRRA